MGQIFDRISRLARTYWTDATSDTSWAEQMLASDDDELRRIIEELNAKPPSPSVPPDVQRALQNLSLPPTATSAEVKAAYRRMIAHWHPDRFASATADEQRLAHERAREINAAYLLLKAYHGIR